MFKLGIWCDYGITLQPSEGIGVFVANLVQGLVHQPDLSEILLVTKDREESLLEPVRQLSPDRIRIVGNRRPPAYLRKPWKFLRRLDRKRKARGGKSISDSAVLGPVYHWFEERVQRDKSDWLSSVDLWLLPYVGLDQSFPKPTVVIVHDLVTYHFPDSTTPEKLESLKR